MHWDNYTTPAAGPSKVNCNGRKLTDFQSRSSVGYTKMTFGIISTSGVTLFKGGISFFSVYKGRLINKKDIVLHHHILCNWFNIDTVDLKF